MKHILVSAIIHSVSTPIEDIKISAWITYGYPNRFKRQFQHLTGRNDFPELSLVDAKWDHIQADEFGLSLTQPARILLASTHGASVYGAGASVISPTDRLSSWNMKHTVLNCLGEREVKATGVIDLACNRDFETGGETDWLLSGPSVEWFIACGGSVTEHSSARALEASLKFGVDEPELILSYLQRRFPNENWRMRKRT